MSLTFMPSHQHHTFLLLQQNKLDLASRSCVTYNHPVLAKNVGGHVLNCLPLRRSSDILVTSRGSLLPQRQRQLLPARPRRCAAAHSPSDDK